MSEFILSPIDEALADLAQGKMVIVVDDEDRENEGDLVAIAEKITPETINFMATHARGLICTPLPDDRCDELGLTHMVPNNTDPHQTAFTVSVDLNGQGVTTGISASDRAKTILALVDADMQPEDFNRPGHIFPLRARPGGVLRRAGHTEAAIDLARLAGCQPAGVIVEIMNEDGTMARMPELQVIAQKHNLKMISIEQLIAYRLERESLIEELDHYTLDTEYGTFQVKAYRQSTSEQVHLALSMGSWDSDETVMVRVQSGDPRGSLLDEITTDYKSNSSYHRALAKIAEHGRGTLICLNQRPNLDLWDQRVVHGNTSAIKGDRDPLDYGVGAQILRDLNVHNINLLTNHPMNRVGIEAYGLHILENTTLR